LEKQGLDRILREKRCLVSEMESSIKQKVR